MAFTQIAKTGGYRYTSGAAYVGGWNAEGYRNGPGHLVFPDGIRYDGGFENGLYEGLGILWFPDGAKYEGEFMQGWFHGSGTFWRADGTKFEGEFRGGRIWGLGLVTFNDGSHGFPRNEGYFQDCKMLKKKKCPDVVQRVQKVALMARMKVNEE